MWGGWGRISFLCRALWLENVLTQIFNFFYYFLSFRSRWMSWCRQFVFGRLPCQFLYCNEYSNPANNNWCCYYKGNCWWYIIFPWTDPGISEGRRGFQKGRHTSAKVRRHAPAKNVEWKVLKKVISSVLRDNCKKKNKQTKKQWIAHFRWFSVQCQGFNQTTWITSGSALVFFLYVACISVYLKLSIIFQHCVGKWDGKQTDYRI